MKLLLLLLLCVPSASAAVIPASLFQDHMVLQCDMPIPVWGTAVPGEEVVVVFADQTVRAIAKPDGSWFSKLEKMKASDEPREMHIGSLVIKDVLVGEVWLASGQSNMGYTLNPIYDATTIAAANHAELRCFSVENEGSLTPQVTTRGQWIVSSPATASGFSAVGYYFINELRRELHVPVGLIHSSVGGTQAESWLSKQAQVASPQLKDYAERQIAAMEHFDEDTKVFQKALTEWETEYQAGDSGNMGFAKGWAKEDFDDSAWQTCAQPMNLHRIGLKGGGIVWLRKEMTVSADKAGQYTSVGFLGYSDEISPYFNGQELQPCWPKPPRFMEWWAYYNIPGNLVRKGRNVIALRIHTHTDDGGMWRAPKDMLDFADKQSLTDVWRCQVETRFPDLTPEARATLPRAPHAQMMNTASALFNGKIHPLIPYALRGAIWYQGESNAGRGKSYAHLLTSLIQDWRTRWGEGDFPFYIVQLANYYDVAKDPGNSGEAEVREAQLQVATTIPKTGLAVTIDIGEKNIHPPNKLDVGRRLALQALAKTYGRQIPCSGPIYRSMTIEGTSIRIAFDHTEGGLMVGIKKGWDMVQPDASGKLECFAIAGADGTFVWADAKIDGENVVVSCPLISSPVAVRYAWATNPAGCNLYNKVGLPASPFRTDGAASKPANP